MVGQRPSSKGCPLYTEGLDVGQVIEKVESLELKDEVVHVGILGIFWGNSLRNPTMQLPITSTCSRCLSTAILPFAMQKPLTKSVKCLKNNKETHNDILDKINETAAFPERQGDPST